MGRRVRRSETVTSVTCDGCGREMRPDAVMSPGGPGLWRSIRVEVMRIPLGAVDYQKSVDLCGECVDRIVVPGVRGEVAA